MEGKSSGSRNAQIREIFEASLDLPPDERVVFLKKACGSDTALQDEVQVLLRQVELAGNPLDDLTQSMIRPTLDSIRSDPSRLNELLDRVYAEEVKGDDPWIGKTVTHFQILEPIGRGGMGVVYKALDVDLGRTVALKFLPTFLSADASAKKRIMHEARTTSALEHPNIATVYEIGETGDGQVFIAMAYYPGDTLTETIERGALKPEVTLSYAVQLASGLSKAHALGIIHRDLKPGNVMTDADGTVKLLDFGLAKLGDVSLLTQAGMMLGTVAYMSPEQARGDKVDHRTDFWSLGVVLYEMLTGQRPYSGDTAYSMMNSILTKPPLPIKNINPKIPRDIRRIINKCLEKNPANRYQQASELLQELRRANVKLVDKEHSHSTSSGYSSWLNRIGAGAVVLALTGMVFIIYRDAPQTYFQKANPPQADGDFRTAGFQPVIQSLAVLPFTNLSSNPDLDTFLTGLHETTVIELAKTDSFKVASRSETAPYSRTEKPLDDIASELGVEALVLGTIQEAGHWVRVSVELLDRRSERHMWAESFDREYTPDEALNLQKEISSAIGLALKRFVHGRAIGAASEIPTKSSEALEAYQEGWHAQNRGTRDDRAEAEVHYLKAIELDPGFALAKAALAYLYVEQIIHWDLDRTAVSYKAQSAWSHARRAIQFDENLSLPYVPLGLLAWALGDPTQAKKYLTRAIDLDPNNASANIAMAWLFTGHYGDDWMVSRIVENPAVLASKNASEQFLIELFTTNLQDRHEVIMKELERDPESVAGLISMGSLCHFYYNQYDEALSWYLEALELAPDAGLPYLRISMIMDRLGKSDLVSSWLQLGNVRAGGRRWDMQDVSLMQDIHREQALGIDFIHSSARSINSFGRSLSVRLKRLLDSGENERALEVCQLEVPQFVGSAGKSEQPSLFRIIEDPFRLEQGNVLDISLHNRVSYFRKAIASRLFPEEAITVIQDGSSGVFTFYMKFGRPKPEGRFPHANITWGLLDSMTFPDPLNLNVNYGEYSVLMRSFEDGFLDIRDGDKYTSITNEMLTTGAYYQIWWVVNQKRNTYDVYVQGGAQFPKQTLIQRNAAFRKKTDAPLKQLLIVNDVVRGHDPIYMDDFYIFPNGQNLDPPSSDWMLVDDFEDDEVDHWGIVGWTGSLCNNFDLMFELVRVLRANGLYEDAEKFVDFLKRQCLMWNWVYLPWEGVPLCRISGLEKDRQAVLSTLRDINASGYAERNFERYPEFDFIRDDPEFQQLVEDMEARLDAQLARVEQMQPDGDLPVPFE